MVFSSTLFLFCFLPVVLLIYTITPGKLRNVFLLLSSLFFYAWGETWFVLVMLASILIDFCAGMLIASAFGKRREEEIPLLPVGGRRTATQRLGLLLSIMANLGILGFFKYFNFSVDSYNAAARFVGLSDLQWETTLQVFLPLGISFFTFQSMSYTFDVYLGNVRATRNLLNFATFVSMFPQLVAGPIVRYKDISERLRRRTVNIGDFSYGVRRFIIGLGKKIIVANAFAVPADKIFAIPDADLTTALAWLGVVSYTFQIYFDFSGYSDMAIGLGRMFGFHYLENFNYPYISRSITEFWRRWHISLSTWFRDYVYIPAGGNRRSLGRTYFNLWMVFFLCGLWHGASWNFVVWGLFHGMLLVSERFFGLRVSLPHPRWVPIKHAYVLLAVMVGWVFFRAESFGQAWVFLKAMAGIAGGDGRIYYPSLYFGNELVFLTVVAVIGSCPVGPYVSEKLRVLLDARGRLGLWPRLASEVAGVLALVGLFVVSAMKLAATTHNPFIYFRF